jgi:hypothetical protein
MTDLLRPPGRRTSAGDGTRPVGRPLMLSAVLGGLASAGWTLFASAAVSLAGWFAADAGRYGDTRDAVRVGADAWLLAHGARLRLDTTTVTVLPLGFTVLCALVAYRVGLRAAARSRVGSTPDQLRPVFSAAAVQAAVYALVALGTAVIAADTRAESSLMRALVGGFLLSFLAGGLGLLVGSGQFRPLLARAPETVRTAVSGAVVTVLLVFAAGCLLVFGALVLDFGTAATVLSRLHADGPGGLMYTVVGILFVPNAALLGGSYMLGPGFALGTGTAVTPTAVVLGPVPAFPLLAALPSDGATPEWTTALLGVPVLLSLVAVVLAVRLVPVERLDVGAMRGLAAGALAAVLFTSLVLLAGGSAGPGRMADVGAPAGSTFLAALVAFGGGGLVGGVLGAWWSTRRARRNASQRRAARV